PAERELVRLQLPAVAIAEFSGAEEMIAALDRAGYFEVTMLSDDDAKRNTMYKENLQRQELVQNFGSYEDYLTSLEMRCEVGAFTPEHAERLTQLINKTNQFNLTTRRYTAAEVQHAMTDAQSITVYGRLWDKFGDNGIVSAMIGTISGDICTIDLWIMDEFVRLCTKKGVNQLIGHYISTAKNLLVRDIYGTMGFEKVQASDSVAEFILSDISHYTPRAHAMAIEHTDDSIPK
ncbi:MAG: HAD family hydrolase, partial [Pygmaiobacter sp.]